MLQPSDGRKGRSARAGWRCAVADPWRAYRSNHCARSAGGRYGAWRRIGSPKSFIEQIPRTGEALGARNVQEHAGFDVASQHEGDAAEQVGLNEKQRPEYCVRVTRSKDTTEWRPQSERIVNPATRLNPASTRLARPPEPPSGRCRKHPPPAWTRSQTSAADPEAALLSTILPPS
jgi:hypothetical protein